jgi:2-iminobutanoate/2-iminopropanoate deaminase
LLVLSSKNDIKNIILVSNQTPFPWERAGDRIKAKLKLYLMKKIINTINAPAPVGPYNQAVLAGNTLYTSGQIAINPKTGELVTNNIEDETKQVMENLKIVLAEADMTFEDVAKTTIFIKNMNDFSKMNAVYGKYFIAGNEPARETVEVGNLPKFVNVEISMIAVK